VHAIKAWSGSRGMAALILNFGTRERWVVSFMPWLVYPQGITPVPVE